MKKYAASFFTFCFFFLTAVLFAQDEPYGGDEPLKPGEAVILRVGEPPFQGAPESETVYLRTAILPMSSPGAPVRIRFEKPVNIAALQNSSGRFNSNIYRDYSRTMRGSWEWKNSRELQFTPLDRVNIGDNFRVGISGEVPLAENGIWTRVSAELSFRVENFQMGNKAGSAPVVQGQPRLIAFLNSGSRRIGLAPLYLLYDQPVDQSLLSQFSAKAANNPLEVQASIPSSISVDPYGYYDTSHVVALTFPELPPDRAMIKITYPAYTSNGVVNFSQSTFTVFTSFSWTSTDLTSLKKGQAARIDNNEWTLRFNSLIDYEDFRKAFSITPQPLLLRTSFYSSWNESGSSSSSTTVEIIARFEIGRIYSMKLAEDFTDTLGNPLKEPLAFAFRSQDLDPVFVLPKEPLVLETGTNRIPARYRNLRELNINVLKFSNPGAYIRGINGGTTSGASPSGSLITVRPRPNTINSMYNADFGIDTSAGLKALNISAITRGTEAGMTFHRQIYVQSTNLGISAKVSDGAVFCWVTTLNNGALVSGAKVSLYDSSGAVIAQGGSTDRNGTINIKTTAAKSSQLDSVFYAAAEYSGDMAICKLTNSEMSSPWQFNLPGAVAGVNPLSAALFSDRGAYRPGESVNLKTFVRDLPEYSGLNQINITVKDSRGKEVYNNSKNLDAYRGASWELKLDNAAVVGEYNIALALGSFTTRGTFQVEEYRVPTFQVNVTSADTAWKAESPASADCAAEYLRGGVLGGKSFSWRIYRQPETFAPAAFTGYIFTLDRDPNSAGTVHDQKGSLNSSGKANIVFRPSFPDDWGPMRYIVQASVTDDDRQTYAGRFSRIVHGADFYAGVRPPDKKIFRTGEKIDFSFVVTDTAGKIRAGQNVVLYIDTFSYNQNTMLDAEGSTSTYNRLVQESRRVTSAVSAAAPQELSYTPNRAGFYRLRLEVTDGSGRKNQTGFVFSVSGGNTVAWPRYDRERIDLVLDKSSYKIGDTASVIVQTPFENARGLLTVEANGVLDAYPFAINNDTPKVTFPVKPSYLPNAYVSVILVRGRTHYSKDATGFETGAPAYRVGYANFEVDPESQRLALALPNNSVTANPAQKVEIAFTVRTSEGKPSDASATVMVVDEAVLGLTGYSTPDPVRLAYAFRVLAVRNASNILDLPHSRRSRFEALFPSGDSDESALLPRSDDILRRLFKSTAFYSPAVAVGADGRGSVSFTLPDNLTTYRVMIIAANKHGMMGQTEGSLLVRKSLAIEPILPRFAHDDDLFTIQARVFNGTASAMETSVGARFEGFETSGAAARSVQVPAGNSSIVSWEGRVLPNAKGIRVTFNVSSGGFKDAVETAIPVRRRGNRQRVAVNALVNPGSSLSLVLPTERSNGVLDISVSDTPLSELKDAVQWLLEYPHGCVEQTTSETYPLIVLADILPSIGITLPKDEIRKYAEAGVARLLTFRTSSGGLSFWPGEDSPHAFGTAFALSALIEAQKRSYSVPQEVLDETSKYLEGIIAKNSFSETMRSQGDADSDTLAYFAMTLGRMGKPQVKLITDLWRNRKTLTAFGLSFLATAHKEANNSSLNSAVPLQEILNEIRKEASETSDAATFEGSINGSWSFDSPTRKNAVALMAYAIAAPNDPLTAKFLRGLLNKQRDGLWGTTQGNVFGIMAIYYMVGGAQSSGTQREFAIVIDGKRYTTAQLSKLSNGSYALQAKESDLPALNNRNIQIEATRPGAMYVSVRGLYDAPISPAFLEPKTSGITFRRSFETPEGRALGNEFAVGSLVRVRLSIANNSNRNYIAIEDLLPAGFEALNTNLLTTETVDKSRESDLARRTLPVISYQEFGDHRAAFYADELKAGNYEFVYYARATTAGTFFLPISLAEAMYDPDSYGTAGGGSITIK